MSFDPFNSEAGRGTDNFDFDYELLDKLLGLERSGEAVLTTPIPATDERNNRLGSEWIRQLEQDLEHFIEDEQQHQSGSQEDLSGEFSASVSPKQAENDFFDREWNDISNMLAMTPQEGSFTSSPFFDDDNHENGLNKYRASASKSPESPETLALNINRELQRHIKVILDRSKVVEQQQKDLVRVTDILASQIDKKIKRKFPVLPFLVHEVPSLGILDKIVQEARVSSGFLQQHDSRLEGLSTRVKEYNKNLKTIPRWTFRERSSLAHGIRAQNEKILLGIIQAKGTHSLEECRKIIESFSEVDLLMNVNGLDWDAIASLYVQTRSSTDCRLQWTINDHPMINRSALFEENQEEIDKLAKIVPKIMKRVAGKKLSEEFCSPWQLVASELGTNRTAIQCFMMYQRKINPNFLKGKWSSQEDEQLMGALKIYGTQNWQAVAQMLEGRTGQQCLHRYEKAINPQIKRGRWSKEEDDKLRLVIEPFTKDQRINWSLVKQSVPGRTDVQCRERWVNVLDPSINCAPFTAEEDRILLNLVELYGSGAWARISIEMGRKRTDNQCWRRWKKICKSAKAATTKNSAAATNSNKKTKTK